MKLVKFAFFLVLCFAAQFMKASAQCSNVSPCQITGGHQYRKIQELPSSDGKLHVDLDVEIASITYDWFTIQRRTYNGNSSGSISGPTWRIRSGDYVTVNLTNNLASATEDRLINEIRYPNRTNLHTHGLHVSSKFPSDNVFVDIDPGETMTYQYQILPSHPAGTYWYHAHLHGSTMLQVQGGLAGLIIIEDPTTGVAAMPTHLAAISCPDNCQHEVPLLFQPVLQYADRDGFRRGYGQLQQPPSSKHFTGIGDDDSFRDLNKINETYTLEDWLMDPRNEIDHFTTNGQLFPVLTFATGQRKRFRMVNAAGSKTLELLVSEVNNTTATDACQVWEIAFDGIYLDTPRSPRLNKTFLVPSSKAEWIVVCNRPGTYELRSVPDPLDDCSIGSTERHDGLLVTLNVTGSATTPIVTESLLPKRPFYVSDFRHLLPNQVSGHFVIEANTKQHLNRDKFSGPEYIRFKAELGTVQEWYLTNSDPSSSHPMHIHVNNFQIISYNNYTGAVSTTSNRKPRNLVYYSLNGDICSSQSSTYKKGETGKFTSITFVDGSSPCQSGQVVNHTVHAAMGGPGTLGYVEPGDFRDVVMVPPLSNITIRFMAHEFTGDVVIHCHILIHEDFGMMMVAEIVEPGADLTANQTSGNAYPGECFGSNAALWGVNLFSMILLTAIALKYSLIGM